MSSRSNNLIGQAVIGFDYFLNTVFNYSTLAQHYKVAAYKASNKIAYVKKIMARKNEQPTAT